MGWSLTPRTPSSLRVKPGLPNPARTVPRCHPLPWIGARGVARCPEISYQGWEPLSGGKTSPTAGACGGWEVDLVPHGPSLPVGDVLHAPFPRSTECPLLSMRKMAQLGLSVYRASVSEIERNSRNFS